ncbi:MAG: hypothetical protein QXP01_06025 [Candidatus Hadarchaeum sp.]
MLVRRPPVCAAGSTAAGRVIPGTGSIPRGAELGGAGPFSFSCCAPRGGEFSPSGCAVPNRALIDPDEEGRALLPENGVPLRGQ